MRVILRASPCSPLRIGQHFAPGADAGDLGRPTTTKAGYLGFEAGFAQLDLFAHRLDVVTKAQAAASPGDACIGFQIAGTGQLNTGIRWVEDLGVDAWGVQRSNMRV